MRPEPLVTPPDTPAFARELDAIEALIAEMGVRAGTAIRDAVRAFETRDEVLARRVIDADARIDAEEEEVYVRASRALALGAPSAQDLRIVLSMIKIAGNLERLADYAKNLAKRASALVQLHRVEGVSRSIRRMSEDVESMLRDVLDACARRDLTLASAVRQRDIEIDQAYNGLFRILLTHMMEDPRDIAPGMHLHFIAKGVERMGDHVTSIADQVIFMVTGDLPADERPKSNASTQAGV